MMPVFALSASRTHAPFRTGIVISITHTDL